MNGEVEIVDGVEDVLGEDPAKPEVARQIDCPQQRLGVSVLR
jgi:hypothetical protein